MMDLWVSKALGDRILLTGDVLWQKWITFANLIGIPDDNHLSLSNGWLAKFKERHRLKEYRNHGKAGSASLEIVEQERLWIQELIKKYSYQPQDIFNMDKTGLFYRSMLLLSSILLYNSSIFTLECLQTMAYVTSNSLVWKAIKSDSHMH
jgi:hypothetical protein